MSGAVTLKEVLDGLPDGDRHKWGAKLKLHEFERLRTLLKGEVGIHIGDKKQVLMESRLISRMRVLGIQSYKDYISHLESDHTEIGEFINALTTNKTDFFRENDHFEFLKREGVPTLLRTQPQLRRINAWSAASSTGEEAYTLGIVLSELLQSPENPRPWDFRLLGTDIDTEVIAHAEAGIYKDTLVRTQIAPQLVQKYFLCGAGRNRGKYRVCDQLRSVTKFRRFNLTQGEFLSDIRFELIFLRNVLIYFQQDTIKQVIERVARRLRPGGYLILGHSESLHGIDHGLTHLGRSIYLKEGRG
jgi:chemotaxis protein methyltransferase CheR